MTDWTGLDTDASEMFWNGHTAPDLDTWVTQYYRRRYGLPLTGNHIEGISGECEGHAARAWALLKQSVYSAPVEIAGEQGATGSDMAARPAMSGGRIPDTIDTPFYAVTDVFTPPNTRMQFLLPCASIQFSQCIHYRTETGRGSLARAVGVRIGAR